MSVGGNGRISTDNDPMASFVHSDCSLEQALASPDHHRRGVFYCCIEVSDGLRRQHHNCAMKMSQFNGLRMIAGV